MTLANITRGAIDFLMKKNPAKFFCMIEGGKIDWACHTNDAAPMVHEVVDTDEAIRVAYESTRSTRKKPSSSSPPTTKRAASPSATAVTTSTSVCSPHKR